ncbi:outer membrane protein [Rhodoferax saidenbachensis]|uniref:Outer membrane protein beta-barrel domain-containing protein n=1 Tax=Rhodoferax saidenbachensis TaxID=1484693 RepID=A0A1P8K650_9BURK|nr:outer membrane beta-barrel protein [Rhodoferax saidenbachensis]APW41492.1 hypothetical protein RS694_02250 [Rhodoferax saidenbachensis]
MKKYVIATAVAAAAFAPAAFAQAKNFEGFSVLGAVNVNSNKVDSAGSSESKTTSTVGIQAGYDFALGESFVLGLGASLNLGDSEITSSGAKLKNATGVYIAPGIAVSKDTLVYAKLASISGKIDVTSASYDISGLGYGIGVRSFINKNVFLQGEYVYNKYDEKTLNTTLVKNETGVLSFGVGYKF